MMSDFWKFLVAVFWHWQTWLGGSGGGGAIVVLVALYQTLWGKTMPKRMYIIIFIGGFLFFAFFMAWRDQYHAVAAANAETQKLQKELERLTKPKLSAKLNQYLIGNTKEGCEFFLDLTIKNSGAPSAATGWAFSARLGEISIDKIGPSTIVDGFTIHDDGKIVAKFHGDFRLEDRTSRSAVQQGLPVGGWLRFIVPGISADKLMAAQKTLYFNDVDEHTYSVDMGILNKEMRHPGAFPGSGDSPFLFPGAPY